MLTRHGRHSVKKENLQTQPVSSKYIGSYKENRTPVCPKNLPIASVKSQESSKRSKIQLKIDRVKNSLFSMNSQCEKNGERGDFLGHA